MLDTIHEIDVERDKTFSAKALRYRASHGPDFWSEESVNTVIKRFQLSADMQQRLMELKERVADIDHFKNDPHILVRFLHGPWGHKEAENQFRKMIEWRKQHNVDTILDDYVPPALLLEAIPSAMLKEYDRDGDPVYVERGGCVDTGGLVKLFGREEMLKYGIWSRERNTNGIWINDYEKRTGQYAKAITIIYDLQGLSSKHLNAKGIEYFKELMRMTKEYFPGPIKKMIIIRCPRIFQVIWSVVKHVFPASARAKMVFLGNNYLDEVDKYMDIRILPPCLYEGGTGEVAVGMMQSLNGLESLPASPDEFKSKYSYPSRNSTADTDEDSVSSDESFRTSIPSPVNGRVILRGSWKRGVDGGVEVSRTSML